VLELMAEGMSNLAIAARFQVTDKAIGRHTDSIFTKLGVHHGLCARASFFTAAATSTPSHMSASRNLTIITHRHPFMTFGPDPWIRQRITGALQEP
jgi:hypothetical protein